jgi:hypothetical protein
VVLQIFGLRERDERPVAAVIKETGLAAVPYVFGDAVCKPRTVQRPPSPFLPRKLHI